MSSSRGGKGTAPLLQNESYKMCIIMCERRKGWTLNTFCRANFAAVCTQQWRMGFSANSCVSQHAQWTERVLQETGCCIDSVVKTRGKASIPEADAATRSFCMQRCTDVFDKETEWTASEVYELCREHF
eukprot:TRINITY_DN75834_c0_g1_i1.p2 TRINITY_DN75834_c0_g1~~TRINITY_DN75834_c0_g1_i1.p2  ORF type:complete len:129 (-),score=23.86 TRINITY_DN75834_c0_g1_i1:51-437(-)